MVSDVQRLKNIGYLLYLDRTLFSADTDSSFSAALHQAWVCDCGKSLSLSGCWFMELMWKLVEAWKLEVGGDFVVVILFFF